jgi:ribosomal protein L30/L7E
VPQNKIEEARVKIKNEAAKNLQVLRLNKNKNCFITKCHKAIRELNLCKINLLQNTISTYMPIKIQDYKLVKY